MTLPPWRESSSLILASRAPMHEVIGTNLSSVMGATKWNYSRESRSGTDFRLLMVKRSGLSSFMANAYVFPGGLTDMADFSPRWRDVFAALGVGAPELEAVGQAIEGPRPPMIQNPLTVRRAPSGPHYIPADVAFRITAIRESFEESGILLLTSTPGQGDDPATAIPTLPGPGMEAWRERVHQDPASFAELCLQCGMCPNIWALREWWNWLTPVSVGHRRYDTMFYYCGLAKTPRASVDRQEVTVMKWSSPQSMLEDNSTGRLFLAPPQVYELSRMVHHQSFSALHNFAVRREKMGVQRWMPLIAPTEDGALSMLPGDELYPAEPDLLRQSASHPEFSLTLEQLRAKSRQLNRMEIRGPSVSIVCAMEKACGHLNPVNGHLEDSTVQSFL
ncbi:NUDT19 [Cordylochernes scorpioides]|uniref:NUDT19 n=1 Tax=Cordylochernes scorpioides TaxID=51811 RepID=A0ABY6LV47_9ARAC|nr:NUDT19 [Cordylochernes scorpioides]